MPIKTERVNRNWDEIVNELDKDYETIIPLKNANCAGVQAWRLRKTYTGLEVHTEGNELVLSLS